VPLVLAGAPIGRPADASAGLASALAEADVVAAEDTRRLRRLCTDLGVQMRGRVLSYFEGNERERTAELLDAVRAGERVVLVTDAGMPTVSDPGYRLVAAAAEEELPVTCVPGPSAVTTALALSGLPTDRFVFEGFLPRKPGERRARLSELAAERRTAVLFEAPHRLAASLADMAEVLGADRRAVVCRELTKTHEEVRRGTLADLAAWAAGGVLGEVTVVLAGAPERTEALTPAGLVEEVQLREAAGLTRKEAVAAVAADTGRPRREVYDAVVAARHAAAPHPDG
jgi:16S rRNA (cytidine1402-2'-O)-methyltransferase